ncbi:MAG TPA: DUF6510 family protein [Microlunatus sp.]
MTPTHPPTVGSRIARLDGNAAGGPLSEIFGMDLTDASIDCRHCRHRGTLAEATVELDGDGLVLICRGCEHQLLSYVWSGGARTVTFRHLGGLILDGL